MAGPLAGVKVVELTGIGPGPFAAMVLSDMGAEVIKVDRAQWAGLPQAPGGIGVMDRGRRSVAVDLKHEAGVETVLRLVDGADALIEGYRPGVAERLGVGPEVCLARNPRLVYGRMTGWGQDGPLANAAGHDINYIALAGVLAHIGRAGGPPTPPLNLLGDFGGGGMLLAFGVVCGVLEARSSGQGQVVDAAMVDGAALLMAMIWGARANGSWKEELGVNFLDTGRANYEVYETADGKFVSIGPIEPQFYAEMLERLGLAGEDLPRPGDPTGVDALKARFAEVFRTKTRDQWTAELEGTDVCFAPVLTMTEAAAHPHIRARQTIVEHDGMLQPAPAPRFSRTPGEISRGQARPGEHTDDILAEFGFTPTEIASLRSTGAVA
ncbi:MAG: CoA transferase [Actinobacteria bacterium]|nr:CoA transferase [Actinomycetota bacterium]